MIPRVSTVETVTQSIDGMDCVVQVTGEVDGLPPERTFCPRCGGYQSPWHGGPTTGTSCPDCLGETEAVFLVVSRMIFDACPERRDLLVPDTGKGAVRDGAGRITAVSRFVRR